MVGWWTGQHYRRAWLRDAGVSIHLCPNSRMGEPCPSYPGLSPNFSLLDTQPPPFYGSFSTDDSNTTPTTPPARPVPNTPLTAALNPDSDVHLLPKFDDIDDGEREDIAFTSIPVESDTFQPIGLEEDLEEDDLSKADTLGGAGVARDAGKSAIPTRDLRGYRTLVVVHTDGIHGIGVGFCKCDGHLSEDEQLLRHGGLYPASQDSPATAFTLQFLEYRHVDDVICKTSSQAHMRKIRRCTEPDEPRLAPV